MDTDLIIAIIVAVVSFCAFVSTFIIAEVLVKENKNLRLELNRREVIELDELIHEELLDPVFIEEIMIQKPTNYHDGFIKIIGEGKWNVYYEHKGQLNNLELSCVLKEMSEKILEWKN